MKRILIYTSALALLAGTLSPAYAHDRGGFRHRNRVIIQQSQPSGIGLGIGLTGLMLLGLMSQPAQPEPLVFPEDNPEPKKFRRLPSEPKLRRDSPIPMK